MHVGYVVTLPKRESRKSGGLGLVGKRRGPRRAASRHGPWSRRIHGPMSDARNHSESDAASRAARVAELPPAEALQEVESLVGAEDADVLALLGANTSLPKRIRKAAAKAVHRLRTRGVKVTASAPRAARQASAESTELPPSVVTPVDARGDRMVWLPLRDAEGGGRLAVFAAVVRDTSEIVRCELARGLTRTTWHRELRANVEREVPIAEVPREQARWLIEEAARAHRAAGGTPPAPFGSFRPLLGEAPDPPAMHPAYGAAGITPGEVADQRNSLAADVERLWEDVYFQGWRPTTNELQALVLALDQVRTSSLYIDDDQRYRAMQEAVDRATSERFHEETRRRYARRLEDNAQLAAEAGRVDVARVALGNAVLLADPVAALEQIPVVTTFFRRNLRLPVPTPGEGGGTPEHGGERRSPGGIILP